MADPQLLDVVKYMLPTMTLQYFTPYWFISTQKGNNKKIKHYSRELEVEDMKVEGYFRTLKRANETIDKLKKEGLDNAYLDLKDDYLEDRNNITSAIATEEGTSLSELVMHSGNDTYDPSKSPIAAANPMISGMAGFEEITDYNYKMVVEVDTKDQYAAENIIRQMGGETEDPLH